MSDQRDRSAENPILVRKYGGSSLASVDRIRAVAADLVAKNREGYRLAVVVSAMGRTTDELQHLAEQIAPRPPRRELDMLLSVGERITMSLLSMALQSQGCSAISFTGSQCGIITDTSHTDARVIEVRADRVRESLADGHVVIVAGFQGVSREREITTLGRGGSDTTAVALAAALGAERCEILKDVDGVFTADPHLVAVAKRHPRLGYRQMEEIAEAGCGVVHQRAVAFARKHDVELYVGSSFHRSPGTVVGPAPDASADAADTAPRWRPLSLVVHENMALLEFSRFDPDADPALRTGLAAGSAAAAPLIEWCTEGPDGFLWGLVAAPESVADLHDLVAPRAEAGEGRCRFRSGLTCLSIAGDPPRSWLEADGEIAAIFSDREFAGWEIRTSGSALHLLAPPDVAARMIPLLHARFWED